MALSRGSDRAHRRHTADNPILERVLECLDKVSDQSLPEGKSVVRAHSALCLAHDDRSPSLSVWLWEDGHVSIFCRAGCDQESILDSLNLTRADLTPKKEKQPRARFVTAYGYHDEDDRLLYQVCRYDPKEFRIRQPDGKRWKYNKKGVRWVLYRLPRVRAAVAAGERVHVGEGEKDANRLLDAGLCATTNATGSGQWRAEYSEVLRGADVVLLQDNDDAGYKHVMTVAAALFGIAKSIRIVLLPGLPPKGDVSNWLDAGHTIEEFTAFVDATPVLTEAPAIAGKATEGADPDEGRFFSNDLGVWRKRTDEPLRLTNFEAQMTSEVVEDDGVERTAFVEVKGRLAPREPVTFVLPVATFAEMDWPMTQLGARATVMPGISPHHAYYAISRLSGDVPRNIIYRHTGWRELSPGVMGFLHMGGAITAEGQVTDVRVRLESTLQRLQLPAPPTRDEAREAVRAMLSLLDVAPARVMFALLAAVWRVVLGPVDLSIMLTGITGVGKTALAALAQQFFGALFDAHNLPASWTWTANAIEALLFHAKNAVSVVDDFNPRGTQHDVSRFYQLIDRIVRAQGNGAGRGRMRADTSLRDPKPPRGMTVITAEDVPTGHSLAARMLILDLRKGDVDWERLTSAQRLGASGKLAGVMSGYLQFLAGQILDVQAGMRDEIAAMREKVLGADHRRTPEIVANLMLGWRYFLAYARQIGAITADEAIQIEVRAWDALIESAELQGVYLVHANPAKQFVALISAAVATGLAHLLDLNGEMPEDYERWGWRREHVGDNIAVRARGNCIGYVSGEDVFLIPDAAYRVAQDMARGGPHGLTIGQPMLRKHLAENGMLKSRARRGGGEYYTVRRSVSGIRVELLHFDAATFGADPSYQTEGALDQGEM
jgi:hypothetical protein